ncbi:phosphatidylserine/phosphatidylglycerophosphate/cardiolipin synthase family protein [Streptomyces sp. NPDC048172]|uniref:phospholipase D-like domain-containing protein n=1 Tax=Streptomyces sp. NPDC048172 TaxID=3365505 RepID=UPI00371961AB
MFNDPADLSGGSGPSAGQAAVMDQLIRLAERVPRGGEIEFVMFEFADGDRSTAVLDALLAAHRRGVHVKVILDSSSPGALARFRQAFGAGKDRASWAVACPAGRGCIGRDYLHSKFALFSSVVVGGKEHRNVVFQTSSNLKDWYLYNSFNDSFTAADARAYADYRRYFADLRAGKPDPRYFWRGPASARYRAMFYPGRQSAAYDPVANDLRRVQCRYTDGGGARRQTSVRIALTAFTKHRLDVARQLRALRDQGCAVDIVHPGPSGGPAVAPEVLRALNPAGRAPVRLTPCRFDPGNGQSVSTHTKVMMIDGSLDGDLTPRVYTGSANFTHLENSDDSTLRVTGRAAHDAYRTWFGKLRTACAGATR